MNVRVMVCVLIASLGPACIDGTPKPPLGAVHFGTATSLASGDYAPSTAGGPARGAVASGGTAGVGGASMQPGQAGASGATPITPSQAGKSAIGAAGVNSVSAAGRGASSGGVAGTMSTGAGGGAAGTLGAAGSTTDMSSGGMLTIDFTSVNQGGNYAPQNVGAVWIETGAGMFVRTLERWGTIRASHLTRWTAASGGWNSFFGIGANQDEMDAVSGATLFSHQAHHLTWDCKDLQKQVMPDGKYNVLIEVTEDNFKPGASAAIGFDKGPAPATVKPPDMAPYKGLTLNYQP